MLGDESDLRARMRLGMTGAVRRLGGARRVTGTSLVALLCASALAPVVVAAGVVVGPVLLAGVGVVGAVGAGVLTDVVTGAVDRLRSNGKEVSQASVEGELALRLEEALASQGNSASALREAVAALLQGVDAVAAVREATEAGDQNLVLLVAEGFAGLDERFNEFTPVIEDIRRALWDLQESARQQQAVTRIEQERGRQDSLMLLQVRQTLERWVTSAARPPEVVGPEDPMWSGCPYLGLVPFEERDARVFYGRSELVRQLVQRLLEHLDGSGILLVVGASGAGKSSLLRAGVMPSLEADALGPGSGKWPRRVIRPTASPMRELAGHLADMAGLEPVSVYLSLSAAPGEIPLLIERAVRTATGLGPDPVRDAPGDSTCMVRPRLVLIIDQFEELLTLGEDTDADPEEREARREQGEAFVTALQAAATMPAGPSGVPGALIVVAVRGDFLDRAIAYPPLAAAVQTGPFAVGPMSEAELRQAITGPAAEAGLAVEPALVEAVVSELRERAQGGLGSGALPLMSQAMAATWERREGNELTLRAYQRAGGITDAVNRSAQTAYDSLTSSQQDAARVVFIRLTAITQDGQLARRRCSRAELYSSEEGIKGDIDAVIGVFSAQRLLVLGEDSIEISHDVLLNAWTKLREWLGDDQLDRALYSQVVNDADAWKANERDSSYLYRSGRLAAIDAATRRWANAPARYPRLPATSAEFLRASERADRRRVRQRRGVIAFLLVLVVGFASVAFGFFRANQNAVNQSHLAQSQSHRAQSEEMAAEAMNLLPANGPLAMLLSLQAYERFHTLQAESALIQASQQPLDYQLASGSPVVDSVAFSPDGKTLAAGGDDGHVGLWDVATGRRTTPLDEGSPVDSLAFSPGGKTLAVGDAGGYIGLWDVATGQQTTPLDEGSPVNSVAFSPGGKTLAVGDDDGNVGLWDVATGQQTTAPLDEGSPVESVAFSPDGKTLAVGDYGGHVGLWDVATGQQTTAPLDEGSPVESVAFSPDGKTLAVGDYGGHVGLWDVATGQQTTAPLDEGSSVKSVAFSRDGNTLAAGDDDGDVGLWDVATGRRAATLAEGSSVYCVAFSRDGKTLAAGDYDGDVGLWDVATGRQTTPLDEGSPVHSVAFSPDGKTLAVGDTGGHVGLWDVATGQQIVTLDEGSPVESVAFSRDGKTLAVGDIGGHVGLWDVATRRQITALDEGSPVESVAFSPDRKTLAVGDDDGDVGLWDVATRRQSIPLDEGSPVNSVAFGRYGKTLAAGDDDGYIGLWDMATGQQTILLTDGSPVESVAFSRDGNTLAAGDAGGHVGLWDVATGQRAATLNAGSTVYDVAFSPDGKNLVTGDYLRNVDMWNVATRQRFADLAEGSPVYSLAFLPHGQTLATGSLNGTIVLRWQNLANLTPPLFTHLICDKVRENIPRAKWAEYAPGQPYQKTCPLQRGGALTLRATIPWGVVASARKSAGGGAAP